MSKTTEIPMVESVMALTFQPKDYLDLPVSVIKEKLGRDQVRRLLKNINLSSIDPVFVLEGRDDELDVTLGPNTLGASTVDNYGDWQSFKEKGLTTLTTGLEAFASRQLHLGLLRYVDVLDPQQLKAKAPQAKINGTGPSEWTFTSKGHVSGTNWFVECQHRGDDALIFLTTATSVNSLSDFEDWLGGAHQLQKRLLWDVVSDKLHLSHLFDDAERELFDEENE